MSFVTTDTVPITSVYSCQVRSGQVRSECLTCTLRASCCSARLSRAQVLAFAGSSVRDRTPKGGGSKGGTACTIEYKGVRAVRPESVAGGGCSSSALILPMEIEMDLAMTIFRLTQFRPVVIPKGIRGVGIGESWLKNQVTLARFDVRVEREARASQRARFRACHGRFKIQFF